MASNSHTRRLVNEIAAEVDDVRAVRARIRAISSSFEAALGHSDSRQIEDYLQDIDESHQRSLLIELLSAEIRFRMQVGESPSEETYRERFRSHLSVVERVFNEVVEATPRPQTPTYAAGDMIGRFEVLRVVGIGRFGVVYAAKDAASNEAVAIKVIPLASESERECYAAEARHMASLDHPGIVKVFETGEVGNDVYLVQELIDGQSLADRLKAGSLTPSRSARMIANVARAIAHAHQRGVIHQDVNPQNILLDSNGTPRLTDFGLAIDVSSQESYRGRRAGTAPYMSPEQVRGESHRLDGRSDIWSLGVVLYEMIARRLPFPGRNVNEVYDAVLHHEPRPPRQLAPLLPEELERICLKCLSKQMSVRYATAWDLAADLDNLDEQHSAQEVVPQGRKGLAVRNVQQVPHQAISMSAADRRSEGDDSVADQLLASSNFAELLQFRARIEPNRIAFRFLADGEMESESVTYGELDQRARAIAAHLRERGAAGQRVLLAYLPSLEFVAALFGCFYAGAAAVPTYPPRPHRRDHRLLAIALDAKPALVLTDRSTLTSWELAQRRSTEGGHLEDSWRGLAWHASDEVDQNLWESWQPAEIGPTTLAVLQYTSGSTATPKGVMVNHRNLLHNSRDLNSGWAHTRDSISVSWLPMFHDLGLVYGVLQPVYGGFVGVLMPPVTFVQRPLRWLEVISRYRATHSAAPNFAYELCCDRITDVDAEALDLQSWTMALNAAEPIRASTLSRFTEKFAIAGLRKSAITPGYGLAESTLKVTSATSDQRYVTCSLDKDELLRGRVVESASSDQRAQALVSSGAPHNDTRLLIVDPLTRKRCRTDEIGEIWVSSPSVANGYWQRAEDTRETFQAYLSDTDDGPFLRTGDLGFMKDDNLFVTGRIKDMIIVRGLNHYPQDIEITAGRSHPSLRLGVGAAFSIDVHEREEVVIAYEVRRDHLKSLDTNEVVSAIRRAVVEEHELTLHAIALLKPGRLPKTSSGKLQRRACRARYLDGSLETIGIWEEGTDTPSDRLSNPKSLDADSIARWLQQWFEEQLGIPERELDVTAPLSGIGLDSLTAVRLAVELEQCVGFSIEPTIFWSHPTIAELSYVLSDSKERDGSTTTSELHPSDISRLESDSIAIVGLGCRYPGGINDIDSYWRLLIDGVDPITEVPTDRWDIDSYYDPDPSAPGKMYSRHGGFLADVDQFDPIFFGISPREAVGIDPQQRLLLEVVWEALENAGIAPSSLQGSSTGVFIGSSTGDYGRIAKDVGAIDAYSMLGTASSIAAGRIAYCLGTHGPTLQLDTACSSSLMAVNLACQNLRTRSCRLAIVGGVNLVLSPEATVGLCKLHALSRAGRCKSFDAEADGYVRSEGCGVVLLKRLEDAEADGDPILATIRGITSNHDGPSNGLSAPNANAQEQLLRTALKEARVDACDIGYIEANGTGTSLGDPIELEAINRVYGRHADQDAPLYVGSAKANLGHLESASGIAGLIKVVLSLKHRRIPRQLHFRTPNPHVDWSSTRVRIPVEPTEWPEGKHCAGISSFGFSGTNVHAIVESAMVRSDADAEAIPPGELAESSGMERPLHILALSAKTKDALAKLVSRYVAHLATHPELSIRDACHTANVGRVHFSVRAAFHVGSIEELLLKLKDFDGPNRESSRGQFESPPKIAFVFGDAQSFYTGMGRQLWHTQPVFRESLQRCEEVVLQKEGVSILGVLYSDESELEGPNTAYQLAAVFAVQFALVETWRSWGIEPSVVLGHGAGEFAAACAAGVITLEGAFELLLGYGRLVQSSLDASAMLVINASESSVADVLTSNFAPVSIAAVDGSVNTVVTGPQPSLRDVAAEFDARGITTSPLCRPAVRSSLKDSDLGEFDAIARRVEYSPARVNLISSATSRILGDSPTAEYWMQHACGPVRLVESINTLVESGVEAVIEIGPRSPLIPIALAASAGADVESMAHCTSIEPGREDWETMLSTLGKLYVRGADVNWRGFDKPYKRRRIVLPNYPFEHHRYWLEGHGHLLRPADDASRTARRVREKPQAKGSAKDRGEIVELIRAHAERVLRVSPRTIAGEQSLFELGMDSLMAVELRTLIERDLGVQLSIGDLMRSFTIDALASDVHDQLTMGRLGRDTTVQSDDKAGDGQSNVPNMYIDSMALVPLQATGSESPLFFIPAGYGDMLAFQDIANILGVDQPVYGLQPARANQPTTMHHTSIYQLVSTYIAAMRNVQPVGPYFLAGYSVGGIVATEVARELILQGEEVALLAVLDSASRTPVWLNLFYSAMYRMCVATHMVDLVRRLRSRLVRRLFHSVLDEGLRTHTAIVRGHRVTSYPGRITYFSAGGAYMRLPGFKSAVRFWRAVAEGGFELHTIPGTHYGMLRRDNAEPLAQELRDCLERCRRRIAGERERTL